MSIITHAFIFLCVSVLVYWFVIPVKWRVAWLFGASLYFMSLFSLKYTIYFVANVALIYMAGMHMGKSERNRHLLLKLSLIWLIGSLCIFKYSHIVLYSIFSSGQTDSISETSFSPIALPLGISYITFRLIHYIVEIYRKTLPTHSFLDLALYVFFFPTFIAGPVERFQRFHPQTEEKKALDPSDINVGLMRILSGIIKKFIVADSLTPVVMPVLMVPQESSSVITLFAVYGLTIRLYMDFSGYTDMALGVSRLFGYKIMENFDYPLFKKNIALFWRSWHISVYNFIRDYFFFPIFGHRASQTKLYVGVLCTMIVFMIWHELSFPFFILGLYCGAGFIVWLAFQELKAKCLRIRKVVDSGLFSDILSTFLTFNYLSFGFVLFSFDMDHIINILNSILF